MAHSSPLNFSPVAHLFSQLVDLPGFAGGAVKIQGCVNWLPRSYRRRFFGRPSFVDDFVNGFSDGMAFARLAFDSFPVSSRFLVGAGQYRLIMDMFFRYPHGWPQLRSCRIGENLGAHRGTTLRNRRNGMSNVFYRFEGEPCARALGLNSPGDWFRHDNHTQAIVKARSSHGSRFRIRR